MKTAAALCTASALIPGPMRAALMPADQSDRLSLSPYECAAKVFHSKLRIVWQDDGAVGLTGMDNEDRETISFAAHDIIALEVKAPSGATALTVGAARPEIITAVSAEDQQRVRDKIIDLSTRLQNCVSNRLSQPTL